MHIIYIVMATVFNLHLWQEIHRRKVFNAVSHICSVVGSSAEHKDMLRELQGDTHWSPHYGTLIIT